MMFTTLCTLFTSGRKTSRKSIYIFFNHHLSVDAHPEIFQQHSSIIIHMEKEIRVHLQVSCLYYWLWLFDQ